MPLSTLLNKLPPRNICLANALFWLVLNTIAAYYNYRMQLHYERPAIYTDIWLEYLPWWGNWAFVAPLVFASTQLIPFKKTQLARFIILNIIASIVLFFLYWFLTVIQVALIQHGRVTFKIIQDAFDRLLLSPLHIDFLIYLAVFCAGYALTYYTRAKQHAVKNQQLAKQLVEVELQSLRSQLNPHFLFNTLNTVASLIRLDEKNKAVKALSELSLMLRKVLENQNNQLIPLPQEIEFIDSYLTIQKMRFEDKLKTEVQLEGNLHACQIPFMLLQPLVENAVQHGSQLESNQNKLTLRVACDDEQLSITLVNKIAHTDDHQGFGIGITNCRQRLDKIYKNRYTFSLKEIENDYFETRLTLPIGVHYD
ncbi:sensor histidine kinase [Thalassotalea sediminis]|uniref:sensor histidine kinase n=1 Tax=Thalassotalea sediminis TaxID=1759089 RepID=UPI0025744544|nr:histidine kinase [Thalassotalea sediminis]